MFDLYEKLNQRTYVIAEMSANHAGSLEHAKEIIYKAKEAGADCIKLQTYTPDTMTIDSDLPYFHISEGTWKGENLYQLYGKASTPWEWHGVLMEEAKKAGIDIFSTPFDRTSVDYLEELGMGFYKIASFELVDLPLLEYVASKGKPMVVSTGMGSLEEIEEAAAVIRKSGVKQLVLLWCASAYPAITDEMNLKTMVDMAERFQIPVGLSDHSMGSLGAVAAVAMGAKVIEKHFCLDRSIDSPDSSFSMNPKEFAHMVEDIRTVEAAIGSPAYGPSKQEEGSIIFRRSVFVVEDMKAGDVITEQNIKVIRPGYGMKPKYYSKLLGKRIGKDVGRGMPFTPDLLEEVCFISE